MSFDAQTLDRLLPAIDRIRDEELAATLSATLLTAAERVELKALEVLTSATLLQQQRLEELRQKASRGPLASLLAVFAEQIGVVEENLEQLYDDLFIETCADWVIPYIGYLIGYESLHDVVPRVASPRRAEVAHTIALRRRKGTATVLEQLAQDVTDWNGRVVEFFQLRPATQYMNHPRPHSRRCLDLRDGEALEWIGTAFENASRTVDMRAGISNPAGVGTTSPTWACSSGGLNPIYGGIVRRCGRARGATVSAPLTTMFRCTATPNRKTISPTWPSPSMCPGPSPGGVLPDTWMTTTARAPSMAQRWTTRSPA